MKFIILMIVFAIPVCGYSLQNTYIRGQVVSSVTNEPLPGATININNNYFYTDGDGRFEIYLEQETNFMEVSYTGYLPKKVKISNAADPLVVQLEKEDNLLKEVIISTGYYQIPKERSTGSFTVIDNKLFNRSTSPDVLSRLEGVTSSLHFDKRNIGVEEAVDKNPQLRIRGISTINSDASPLVILDNFPYNGDISLINPNDVESVTMLKDAAAASIWGARAGNGVIVITTKKGTLNKRPSISFNSGITVGEKPDLAYNPNFLESSEVIEVEKELFSRGYYQEDDWTPLSPVVELLIAERDGQISPSEASSQLRKLKSNDIRKEALNYLYQQSLLQQYSFDISGGSNFMKYYLSAGFDKSMENVQKNNAHRVTFNAKNSFNISENLELLTNISFAQNLVDKNGLGLHTFSTANTSHIYSYASLKDGNKNLPIVAQYRTRYIEEAEKNGLMNWEYIPLNEVELNDNRSIHRRLGLNAGVNYKIFPYLTASILYNYQLLGNTNHQLFDEDSYFARNEINRFTQEDGTRVFPEGAILKESADEQNEHMGRAQLNFDKTLKRKHSINFLAGAEIRQVKYTAGPAIQLNGFNPQFLTSITSLDYNSRFKTRPYGFSSSLPAPPDVLEDLTDRFLSYYANASYSYDKRITVTGSARWDASNLFGVNTNQKGVPLWSLGTSWHISEEDFYNFSSLSKLALRATYGYNGNVNKSVAAYPTARYSFNQETQLKEAYLRSPGNPDLRWEKIGILNFGVDVESLGGRIFGSFDFYWKNSKDLLGNDIVDPTTGISTTGNTNLSYLINYANLETKGFDVELHSRNLTGKIIWNTSLLINYSQNEIKKYNTNESPSILPFVQNLTAPPLKGESKDVLYSFPWNGLDPKNGYPLVYENGELTQNYSAYINALTPFDLIRNGVSVPPLAGSIRNTVQFKNLTLSANILWKTGYYFRRSSIVYGSLFNDLYGHRDFKNRWQNPGDENFTDVPAFPLTSNGNQDNVYRYSERLVEKGDHVRLQDIQLSYLLNGNLMSMPVRSIEVSLYANNLGILWRANKRGLDPDYPSALYPPSRTYVVSLKVNF